MLNFWDFADKHPVDATIMVFLGVIGVAVVCDSIVKGVQNTILFGRKLKEK